MRSARTRFAVATALSIAVWVFAHPAHAHAIGLSRGDYERTGGGVTAKLTFARRDVDGMDAGTLLRGVIVTSNGKPCAGTADQMAPVDPDGVAWTARFACVDSRGPLGVRVRFFDDLPQDHRHAAHLQAGEAAADDVLYRRHDEVSLAVAEGADDSFVPIRRSVVRMLGMIRMGVEHILTGYDHLAFLFGLVIVGGRWRSLVAVVTAFTVAHSLTLAVAALGVWTPPARVVEPAIALSIAYVGVENFFLRSAEGRWRVTFPFGLLHGFGFASALRDIALPRAEVPVALLSFNVGVELGQLTVLAALLPLLAWLRRSSAFSGVGVRALSAAIAAMGALWFVARVGTT
jgi:hypothetical protein